MVPFTVAFNAEGGGLDSDSAADDGFARMCFSVVADQRVIVAVTSHEGRSTGPFSLQVRKRSDCTFQPPAEYLTDEGNGYIRGEIGLPGEEDSYVIPVRRTGWMVIEADTRNSTLVPFLRHSYRGGDTDDGRDGRARFAFPATAGDVVNVTVSGLDGTVGPYTLLIRQNVVDITDDHADLADQSGQAGRGGTPLVLDQNASGLITGGIQNPKDRDSFEVTAVQDGLLNIEVVPTSGTLRAFLQANWFDRDLGRTEGNTDVQSGRGANPRMCLHGIRAGDKAYFRVWADGDDTTGDYLVHVWQSPACPSRWHDDPQEIGPFLPPLALDGFGNGQFVAGIDYLGDRDMFRIDVVRTEPLTIQVMPPAGGNDGVDTFVTLVLPERPPDH